LGIEFYPKAKEGELRQLIEGEMAKRNRSPEKAPKPKPEAVGAK
jgi:hypothetical protein